LLRQIDALPLNRREFRRDRLDAGSIPGPSTLSNTSRPLDFSLPETPGVKKMPPVTIRPVRLTRV
jgi:hypothetical protein